MAAPSIVSAGLKCRAAGTTKAASEPPGGPLDGAIETGVEVAKGLVVQPSCGLCALRIASTKPGLSAWRPTRLVAWIYSAAALGWPCTAIRLDW